MQVEIDYSTDSLGVYLDNGKEVGRYCIVENPEQERDSLEKMIRACIEEGVREEMTPQCAVCRGRYHG